MTEDNKPPDLEKPIWVHFLEWSIKSYIEWRNFKKTYRRIQKAKPPTREQIERFKRIEEMDFKVCFPTRENQNHRSDNPPKEGSDK